MSKWSKAWVGIACATSLIFGAANAAPPSPLTDDTVLLRVPKRTQPRSVDAAKAPDLESAIKSAQQWIDTARRDHDPRSYGYAQQALAPWWTQTEPPLAMLRLRATILQVDHHFELAYSDLKKIIALAPQDAQAQLDAATLLTTSARYREARIHCAALAKLSRGLIPVMCQAQIDGVEGDVEGALIRINTALRTDSNAPATIRAWATTLAAELYERAANNEEAQRAFATAIALNPQDMYTRIAFADFLLSKQESTRVFALFEGAASALPDAALLRLAIAAKRSGRADAEALRSQLQARLQAGAQRGDTAHAREAALFALHVEGNSTRAAELALSNWKSQKEPTDALLLLQAGRTAKNGAALQAANEWLAATRFQHPSLTQKTY